jgi:hypothetical protein
MCASSFDTVHLSFVNDGKYRQLVWFDRGTLACNLKSSRWIFIDEVWFELDGGVGSS